MVTLCPTSQYSQAGIDEFGKLPDVLVGSNGGGSSVVASATTLCATRITDYFNGQQCGLVISPLGLIIIILFSPEENSWNDLDCPL